jgi:DNA-binding transcriptional regulator YiaG
MTPAQRCGLLMQRWRENPGWPPVLDPPVCGRPAGHPGRHRSETALEMTRRRRPADTPSGSPAIAAVILEARTGARMSRRRLAAHAGVTEQCVQHWEAGRRKPSPERWERLTAVLATGADHASAA